MNKQPIENAQDPDLRSSQIALRRAAMRAREVARATGTSLVVMRDGRVELMDPEPVVSMSVQESHSDYRHDG